ncbi:hypothetical protein SAMN05444671_0803 [Flavobacterium sp. CF108]|uniref:hypothetical protein n=1 Tax=unclassified Flavobacterium TaxID=196869 RepID=UPI0008B05BCB|nr:MULTISPECIES: hypothetical protein [unclassified Flavobacterium]SEO17026.1 hypothetical protein SAMN04487978_2275 [Flavobacterium sp. fv08]SHG56077.1 hypothetical protein SAMN05444671_0803 [Flavobacterium sp. CF108]
MENLLEYTINAHGGIENWNKFESITARLLCGGVLWDLKQQSGVMQDIYVTSNTRKQMTSHYPFINEDWSTSFEPGRIAIQKKNGEIIEEMSAPRDSFSNHVLETPWTQLQLAYFAGYAMWTYFNLPFIFKNPDYKVTELEPWNENGELYRRLEVTFPDEVAAHSGVQTFYIDKEGLIKRHDYNVDISAGAAAAHYLSDYIEVQGIKIPTKRRVYIRLEDNSVLPEPLLVSIDLSEIVLK